MTSFLIKRFIKDYDQIHQNKVRTAYGKLAGVTGIAANLLLFASKLFAGVISGSLSIVADSFNNLSDAGSSIVTLIGFKLSSAPPDEEHPFGHGRLEYLSALLVAVLIMIAGYELASASVGKILNPTETTFTWVSIAILVLAIGVKLWMALFYRNLGKLINSEVLKASSADSRNDVVCTSVVLVSSVIGWVTGYQIDGVVGVVVAAFVMWSGFSIIRDAISPLLGQAPEPDMVEGIRHMVLKHDGIIGIHDLMIHNYGPGRLVISLHAEVPCQVDMIKSHDLVDCIEKEIMKKYQAVTCIHMDPVDTEDARISSLRELVEGVLNQIDVRLNLHDFRVVFGESHTNLIFDLVIPFDYKEPNTLSSEIQQRVKEINANLYTVVTIEHDFT